MRTPRAPLTRACLAALVLLPSSAAVAGSAAPTPAAPQWATPGGVAGTASTADGTWAWQDFVYDDGSRRGNTADLVEVRVRPQGDDLAVRVALNSLTDAASTVVGLAVADGPGAARPWPASAGVASPWDAFLTVAEGVATTTRPDGTSASAPADVDLADNTITFLVEGAGARPSLLLTAGAGGWDAAVDRWVDGVVDLAFNAHAVEPFGKSSWRDATQAATVATGDVSSMAAVVDLDAVRAGVRSTTAPASGLVNRVYRSRQRLGEGYGSSFPRHRGLYQPYTAYVPTRYDGTPTPLRLVLHSLNNTHNEYSATAVYRDIAEADDALALTPLALGTDGWYWDEALVDTLDAWADLRRAYAVDEERTTVAGYSMGGYGTYRLTTLMPDRFAAAAVWAAVPAYTIWAYPADPVPAGPRQGPGNTSLQLESARQIPFYVSHGVNDQLVPVSGVVRQTQRMDELGMDYRFNQHAGFDHYTFRTLDVWTREGRWLADRARTTAPSTVSLRVRPQSWVTADRTPEQKATLLGHLAELGADLDSAYWVRDVAVAGTGDVTGAVDLTATSRRDREPVTSAVLGAGTDYPTPYTTRGQRRGLAPAPVGNALVGTLTGVQALTVDLDRAGLRSDGLVVDVAVDREVTLTLASASGTRTLRLTPR